MRTLVLATLLSVATLAPSAPAHACLWDTDTLKEEALGQAEIVAILGGDLHKHDKAFYEAKVTYTKPLVADPKTPKLAERFDDLAVAYAKLGKLDEALAVLATKEQQFPGAYTTHANRGTFLAMKGDLAGALDQLGKAIAINPDAHFGREKVQIQFLEYLGKLKKDASLGDTNFLGIARDVMIGRTPMKARARKANPAVLAIAGLLRFGDGQDNPHLWYGLGWALLSQGDAQLAMRAFRRAELLGHPRGKSDGAIALSVIQSYGVGYSERDKNPKAEQVWVDKVVPGLDKEWAAGVAADAKRQAAEGKQVAAKQWKAVFGY